ncbi:MAG: FAD-binding oxidoreductase [Bacteroidota bacterium]
MNQEITDKIDPEKRAHRWGFRGTGFEINDGVLTFKSDRPEFSFFANQPLPDFLPYVFDMLGTDIVSAGKNEEATNKRIQPAHINETFFKAVTELLPQDRISSDDGTRLIHSHAQTTSEEVYKVLYNGELPRLVDLVIYPKSDEEISTIIKLAGLNNVCLVPFGGGTSVSSALLIPKDENRMVVSVDMRMMDEILWIDEENNLACIQAGIAGRHLEEKLGNAGYTMGHEPDSIEFSTLGGWIATNASGMKRNKYGNIEDIIQSFVLVSPEGTIREKSSHDRVSMGMPVNKAIFGSEGNLGIITSAIVKIHPKPEKKEYESIVFPDFEEGLKFLRAISKTFIKPASIRLVDNNQFKFGLVLKPKESDFFKKLLDSAKKAFILKIKKFDPDAMCLATIVMEGNSEEVYYQKKIVKKVASQFNTLLAGGGNGKRGYALTNVIAYIRDFLLDYHCIGETLETTIQWDKVSSLGKSLEQVLIDQHKHYQLPGNPYLSYRVTQLYHSSVCVYIMFGVYTKGVEQPEEKFKLIEEKMREKVIEAGGSISHHHGVGKLRKKFIGELMNKEQLKLAQSIKKELDPQNIFGIGNTY